MALKKGDFVELEYTAKLKESGEVFDSTDEKVAKETGFYSEQGLYGPLVVKLGEGQVLKGLEDALVGKELGKHVVELSHEQAFGSKNAKLVHLIPLKKFHDNNINPVPGLRLNIDGLIGIIRAKSGGRVLVDFNHPLAGKEVVYEVDVKRTVTDVAERLNAMLRIGTIDAKVTMQDGKPVVTTAKDLPPPAADMLGRKLTELVGTTVTVPAKAGKPTKPKADKEATKDGAGQQA